MNVKNRIEYLDNLRFFSILGIIAFHISMLWYKPEVLGISIVDICAKLGKSGVPIFLMISGALLLKKKQYTIKDFYKKRFPRVTIPFLFWIVLYIMSILYIHQMYNNLFYDITKHFFDTYMWYFYLIIGVYLALPFINDFINSRDLNEVKYFVIIFISASTFYFICRYFNIFTFLDLRFFIGGIGYLVLGYYLANVKIKSANKTIFLSTILLIVCLVMKVKYDQLCILDYVNDALFLKSNLDISFFEIGLCSSIFLIFRSLEIKKITTGKTLIKRFILSVSKASYGMYLIHVVLFLFIKSWWTKLPGSGTQILIIYIIITLGLFLISWILVILLSKLPYLKEISGYH